jgi:hypothetical protein
MNARNVILYLGGAVVMIAVIGAIYLEIVVQSRSTHDVWMVTEDVSAGAQLTNDNIRRVSMPDTGDRIAYYSDNPVKNRKRAGHVLSAGHMIADDDLLTSEMVLVPVTFKAAPPLRHGDVIDVYTVLGAKTIQVGKSLVVDTPTTILVPAVDEPSWITLQANNAPLFAANSSGIGVPAVAGLAIQDAVSALSGSVAGGAPAVAGPPLTPSSPPALTPASPTPAPGQAPRPSPSPSR